MFKRLVGSAFVSLAFSAAASAAPTLPLGYGDTTVKLDAGFVAALTSLNVTPSAIGSSRLRNGAINFPITDGDLDFGNAKGEISHSGGLTLKAGNTSVELRDFLIDTSGAASIITGKVVVNDNFVARIPLFDLTLPALSLPLAAPSAGLAHVTIPSVKVKLNAGAAGALNSVFGITALAGGFPIGEATVRTIAFGQRAH
jgi:hypothetical protein